VNGENHSTLLSCWCNGSLNAPRLFLQHVQIMVISCIPREEIRHTRAVQD